MAVHDSCQNDRNPVIWQPGQDYRMADALHAVSVAIAARSVPALRQVGVEDQAT